MDRAATDFVNGATGSAIVRSRHVQSLWGGYGELSRVELASGESVILKDVRPPAHGDDARSHARKCRSYDVECAFYRDYASRTDDACRVPRPIAVRATAGRWLLLLEDLDAAGFPGRKSGRHARDLGACIDWLAAFHARFVGERPVGLWESGTSRPGPTSSRARATASSARRLRSSTERSPRRASRPSCTATRSPRTSASRPTAAWRRWTSSTWAEAAG